MQYSADYIRPPENGIVFVKAFEDAEPGISRPVASPRRGR